MANPRQRRKARSSSHRPVSHSKHAKRNLKKTPSIRGPKVLQEAWDKKKTVRQNYARLGLAASLDPSTSGGTELPLGQSTDQSRLVTSSSAEPVDPSTKDLPCGFGRILRDATGNVVGVDLNEGHEAEVDLEDIDNIDSRVDQDVRRQWVDDFTKATVGIEPNDTLIKGLEHMSASIQTSGMTTLAIPLSGVGPRHVSVGELKYLQLLTRKHGRDVKAMAADLKLNPEQRTIGQLRRALRKVDLLSEE